MEAYNKASAERLRRLVSGKKALFVTTKDMNYIRNTQEISLLREFAASVTLCGSNAKTYPLRLLKVYFWLLFHSLKGYEVIFLGFAPQLLFPFFRGKFRHSCLIIDFFISLYDTLTFDRKKIKPRSVAARIIKKQEMVALAQADYVIADTCAHGEYFAEELGLNREKLIVLYLEADTSVFYTRPDSPEENRASKEGDNKLKVLYFGSILPLQGVDVVIECIRSLRENEDIEFTLIGPLGKSQKKLLASLDTVRLFNWKRLEELALEIQRSDLCLGGHFCADIEKAKRTIPGKVYIYRAMRRPVILGECPANRELFIESDEIFYVPQGNPDALANRILWYRDNCREG